VGCYFTGGGNSGARVSRVEDLQNSFYFRRFSPLTTPSIMSLKSNNSSLNLPATQKTKYANFF